MNIFNIFKKIVKSEELPLALYSENCMGYSLHCPHCQTKYGQTPVLEWMQVTGKPEKMTCITCQNHFTGIRGM